MNEPGDRSARADEYVRGLMSDDERERAERDLEIDPSFRDAVVETAERLHLFDIHAVPQETSGDGWKLLEQRISALPQMQAPTALPSEPSLPHEPPATFGRRRTDPPGQVILPAAPSAGTSRSTAPGRRVLLVASLLATFLLGYVAGTFIPI